MNAVDEPFMRRAIALAKAGEVAEGAAPIGAVLVVDGLVIGEGHNRVGQLCDPTAHAEVMAMRAAGQQTRQARLPAPRSIPRCSPAGCAP